MRSARARPRRGCSRSSRWPSRIGLEKPPRLGRAAQDRCWPRVAPGRSEARRAAATVAGPSSERRRTARSEEGTTVFEKNCGICHQLGGKGAKVGPQLDGIGSRGLDRLVEDILDPNRNVDQAFRVTVLALENGQVVSGLLLREEGEILVLADAQGKEMRIPRSSVDERKTSPLSPMPANFTDQISGEDFNRLLDYLLSKREPSDRPPGSK